MSFNMTPARLRVLRQIAAGEISTARNPMWGYQSCWVTATSRDVPDRTITALLDAGYVARVQDRGSARLALLTDAGRELLAKLDNATTR